MSIKRRILSLAGNFTKRYGYEIVKIRNKKMNDPKAEAHPAYMKDALAAGMDVNDFQEIRLGFAESLPLLNKIVFPVTDKINEPVIIELGPGSGRWSRHIINKVKEYGRGRVILIDHSEWIVNFLKDYFKNFSEGKPDLSVYKCDGFRLPENIPNLSADLIFASNTFVALGIYFYFTYSHDFFRVLKSGGYCIFDYIDLNTEGGWNFLLQKTKEGLNYYTYYTFEAVNKVFTDAGFEFVSRHEYGKSTYLIYRKP